MSAPGNVEAFSVEEWITSTLNNDPTMQTLLGTSVPSYEGQKVWNYMAAEGTPWPYVVFGDQASNDVRPAVGPGRILNESYYRVLVWGETPSPNTLKPVVKQVDLLLHGVWNTAVGDGRVLACVRTSILRVNELRAGKLWRGYGGLYRIQAV